MKKVLSLSLVGLLTLSLISCSSGIKATTSPESYSDLDKEYGQFNTKALTVSYLKKKLDKWKTDGNGKKMLRELEYAKFKHINVLEQVINSQPDSYAYYEGLKSFIEITSKEGNDAAFKSFIVSLSPDPSSVTSLDASNITSTSFTANWSVVTNATGYMLIVDNGTPIDVGNVTSKNITGLSAGSSHSYVVKSVNEGGISEASSPINVTLKTDTPVASDATNLAQTSFTANWASVTGATSYNLFVDGISVYTGSSTSCNVTSLAVGSSHSYYVQAINSGGTSSNSNTINLTLNPAIAGVPVASDATDITQTSFTANWGTVSGATSYKLKVDNGSFTDVGNITSKNITGLTAGTTHTYVVQAVNISGASADSNTVSVSTIPLAPVASVATDITNTSFTASWGTVTGATSYKLFIDDVEAYSGTNLNVNKTGLTANSSHSYYVQAINAGGTSANSNTVNLSLNPNAPTAPVANIATDITTTSFTANWATVTGATSYKLFIDDVEAYSGTNLNFSKTGLTAGSSHSYYVTATNITGTSSNSNTINISTVPLAPVASVATDITNTSFTASWNSVTGANSYKLFIDDVEAYSGTNLSFSKTGLTANSSHSYYVQAINSGGTSTNSSTINVTLNPDAPTAPVASAATTITTTSFTANWGASTNATSYTLFVNGTSVYTGTSRSVNVTSLTAGTAYTYYVQASNVTGTSSNSNTVSVSTIPLAPVANVATNVTNTSFTASWATVTGATSYKLFIDDVEAYSGTNLNFSKTGLTASSTHSYYVQAINSGGTSANSSTINVTLNPDAPTAPVASAATTVATTSFTANWGASTNATSYTLFVNGTSVYTGTSRSVNVTSLTAGTAYTYYVQASNVTGTSSNSNSINVTTVPVAPTANTATNITSTSFTASWGSITGATSYNLFVDGTSVYTGTNLNYGVTGLSSGITHTYYVQAINSGGSSASSTTINALTIPSAPVANAAIDVTQTSFTANWGSVTGAASYKLFIDSVEAYSGTATSFSKTGLTLGSTHTYYVQAINASGTSANSSTITAKLVTQFVQFDAFPTSGIFDLNAFTIGTDHYFAESNFVIDGGYTVATSSYIYKWNTSTGAFGTFQTIPTLGSRDSEAFTVGSDNYIMYSNFYDNIGTNNTRDINSKLYKFNTSTGQFVDFQTFATSGAIRSKAFKIGSDAYLAIGNYGANVEIYKWNGTQFASFQSLAASGPHDTEYFTIGTDIYLAVAFYDSTSASNIYKWNGTQFVQFQSVATNKAYDWEHFTIGTDHYLAGANSSTSTSNIYKWNGTQFVQFQALTTSQAQNMKAFNVGTDYYIAVANNTGTNTDIYKWNGSTFVTFQSILTDSGSCLEHFVIDTKHYLVIGNMHNGTDYTITSKIYRFE